MMATRPGPLRDIPLDHERLKLYSSDGHIASLLKSPGKRPPSPSSYAVCSPSKRRLVEQESHSNTPNGSRHASTPHQAHVRAILHGPNSPARKLEFGGATSSAQNGDHCMDAEPPYHTRSVTRQISPNVAPSPLLPSFATSSFRPATKLSSTLAPVLEDSPIDVEMKDRTADPQTPTPLISREALPPNRTSVHYPGFDIYEDVRGFSPVLSPVMVPPPLPSDPNDDGHNDTEVDKENIRPVRPSKLCFGEAAWAKAGLLCPREVEMLCSPAPSSALPSQDPEAIRVEEEPAEAEGDRDVNMSLSSPRAPRRIRDIGNISVRPHEPHGKLMLTSSSFSVLGTDKEKERTRKKGDDVDDRMMDVENKCEENHRRG
ncbi:hypothetical protein NM688_g2209 [Phlebia brevispora]|uniref:Uncharacterized protein n=1 Tax=Phlebia brevispora TaxID=194682 RepID=A0ACC1T9H6_9APHY|nr:hypothetical protein NM688_g2209 [Phlebia brevispora]